MNPLSRYGHDIAQSWTRVEQALTANEISMSEAAKQVESISVAVDSLTQLRLETNIVAILSDLQLNYEAVVRFERNVLIVFALVLTFLNYMDLLS